MVVRQLLASEVGIISLDTSIGCMIIVTLLNVVVITASVPCRFDLVKMVSCLCVHGCSFQNFSVPALILFDKSCRIKSQLEVSDRESACSDLRDDALQHCVAATVTFAPSSKAR